LSLHLAYPHKGHLDVALHMMGYLKLKNNSQLIFDPTYPNINESTFQHHDWEGFYRDVNEVIPTNAPSPLGKEVDLHMMVVVDNDHAGKKLAWHLRTGYLMFLNMSLIAWLLQKQPTIESLFLARNLLPLRMKLRPYGALDTRFA
jgi:hypothetical protein